MGSSRRDCSLMISSRRLYTGVFLLEYEIATRGKSVGQRVRGQSNAKGQDSRQRFDLVLQVSAL
jgi:hypothetical protein